MSPFYKGAPVFLLLTCAFTITFITDTIFSASNNQIERILNRVPGYQKDFAILIQPISFTGQKEAPILTLNETKLMIPASITKLVTAYFVLDSLGSGETVKNKLFAYHDKVGRHSIRGPIIFRGSGDPGFVSESMWSLVNDFYVRGYREISGDLWIDTSLFDDIYFDESRLAQRANRAYDAPVSSVSFNWNSVNFHIFPGAQGEKAEIQVDPMNDYIKLENKVTTKHADTMVSCSRSISEHSERFVISGTINKEVARKILYCPIQSPPLWFGYNLKAFLQQRGIKFNGDVLLKSNINYENLVEVAVQESKPISAMVADMNKFSNNYVAEMLVKLVTSHYQVPASLAHGMSLLNQWLEKKGIDAKEQMRLINPSGLTRENLLSAKAMYQLLVTAYLDFKVGPEFIVSLPVGGVDGTLKDRFTKSKGIVRAKTGYLNQVVSLAGYLQSNKQKKIIPFVFIYNGAKVDEAKNAIDQVIHLVLETL
ncbi:MAG: D-alanyl-D-alanine carboxypeptidase/D-alanyl-D-alanine-endopeptidase [Bdellovibrionaceae bacterium]|nr:D-alanyl-D-alanine carboxypeptidase/D-alanyl-D-alanine-endopeptidase [Pseudobdellovibrionaceae bacterium]MDW8190942.1 D-alanyl-D-alanine carboxypeptidase/D-alanyl-D-alanine-endopeptidase [Pseudobdellovibrionaceae bacterium]